MTKILGTTLDLLREAIRKDIEYRAQDKKQERLYEEYQAQKDLADELGRELLGCKMELRGLEWKGPLITCVDGRTFVVEKGTKYTHITEGVEV